MKHLYKLLFIFILFPIIFFSSCTKEIEKKVEGKWKRVMVENMNSAFNEYWVFGPDGKAFIHTDADPGNGWLTPVNDSCSYVINSRLRRSYIYLYMDSVDLREYYGVWEIIYVRKNTMMIVLRPTYQSIYNQGHREINPDIQGGLLFREFVKVE